MPQMRNVTCVAEPISVPSDGSFPAFFEACRSGDVAAVTAIVLAQDRPKDYLSRGLRAAAGADQADIVRYLLERGAGIDPYLDPLAALRGKSLDTFKLLIEYGWDVKDEGYKILPYTVQHEHIARYLLDAGASPCRGPVRWNEHLPISHPDFDHNAGAALNNAASSSTPEMFDLLLKRGAPLDAAIPLHAAAVAGRIDMLEYLLQLRLGLDVNALDEVQRRSGRGTPLHCVLWYGLDGAVPMVRWLLEHGADPEKKSQWGKTARELAAKTNNPDIVAAFRREA